MGLLCPWYVIIIPMDNVHPYFPLKNLGKKVHIIQNTGNSGSVRWKRCIGQGMGKGHRASMPSSLGLPLFPNLHVFTHPEALQTPSFWIFVEASLHSQD